MGDLRESLVAIIEHIESDAERRGYERGKREVESRERYLVKREETISRLAFPSTFNFTLDHLGWLIANHRDATNPVPDTFFVNLPGNVGEWTVAGMYTSTSNASGWDATDSLISNLSAKRKLR